MVSYFWPPEFSGAALQAYRLSRELQKRGHDILVVTSCQAQKPWKPETSSRFELVCIPRLRPGIRLNWVMLYYSWRLPRVLRRYRKKFDLVHVHGAQFYAPIVARSVSRMGKRCLIKNTLLQSDLDDLGKGFWGSSIKE